jgi:hypothetical protein
MDSEGAVEDLLSQVASFAPIKVGDTVALWVPDSLTFRGDVVPQDIAMALVLDSLLSKGLYPDGFEVERGGRRYRYRFEG